MARYVLASLLCVSAVMLGGSGWWQQSPTVMWYRVSTSAKALYALYTLPQDHVEKFLGSYKLFDQETMSGETDEAQLIVNYYQVVNHLCAVGEVEKMYIPPVMDSSIGIFGNQVLWEEKGMGDKLDVGANSHILDMGCGRGRIAHHMASYTGGKVTGLNIDPGQIATAEKYARATGMLGNQLNFVRGNFNDPLPFKDNTFDALYQVQVLTYAKDQEKLFAEMFRVLKPGAKLSFLDWFQLDKYDPNNAHHKDLLDKVKPLIGAVYTPKPQEFVSNLEKVGFKVLMSEEASVGGHQWPLVKKADDFYQPLSKVIKFLVKVGIVPVHLDQLFDRLAKDGQAFVDADQLGIFTTSWQIIAQKPK